MTASDTIFALASASGRAGVAVYRLSGPGAGEALRRLTGRSLPQARKAVRACLRTPAGEVLDDGLALWFPAPASFTGEDVAELHLHGGRAVSRALAETLRHMGLRPAEPGEFSRRAFRNGKLDLTQAEAVADLVKAETEGQRRQALRQMDGALTRMVESWRSRLVAALAHLEAAIDFADEEIPDGLADRASEGVAALIRDLAAHLADGRKGERLRDGIHIAILGAPNAGKSRLLNRLAGREAAIVSDTAGTTRDVIEVHLDLEGWPVVLADTAGLRDAACDIEAEGMRRALARAESADLKLAVFDGATLDSATLEMVDDATLVVLNKADLGTADWPRMVKGRLALMISAKAGDGVDTLVRLVADAVECRFARGPEPVLTRARHRAAVEDCLDALHRFDPVLGLELAAEDLRRAAHALARIAGRVEVDEVLDVIFHEFCIGK